MQDFVHQQYDQAQMLAGATQASTLSAQWQGRAAVMSGAWLGFGLRVGLGA